MQGLPLFWIELKRTGEGQGVIPHGAGVCVGGLDRVAVFAGSHGNDVIRASGPVAAPIRSSWRVPMSNAGGAGCGKKNGPNRVGPRSEEHTSELQSLMRISYAVFCLKKKKNKEMTHRNHRNEMTCYENHK